MLPRLLPLLALLFAPLAFADEVTKPKEQVSIVLPEGDGIKYWPHWRGPKMDGHAQPGAYPAKWSSTENVLWKVPVPGAGNSSPVIWADRIFLTAWYDKGDRRSILCLHRDNGKVIWEAFVPQGMKEKTIKDKNGYASGSATTDGERIYAYFGNYGLFCVDWQGKKVWQQTFGDMDAYHGMACTPLLYRDRVIIYQEHRGPSGSFVVAFDKKTGKQLWKTPRKEKVGWGSPIAIRVGDQEQIIVSSQSLVYAYDPANGQVIWTCNGNLYEVIPMPVVAHDMLFCCSGRAGPTLAIRPQGGKGDITKTHLVWRAIKGSPFVPSPLVVEDNLYMINDIISVATCYNAKTGTVLWQDRLGPPVKEGFSASPVYANGKVFYTSDQGDTYVLKAGPKFELLHINRLGEKTLASPAMLDGKWYIRTQQHLYCIGNRSS